MPEGPELNIAARFVNKICADHVFSGAVCKSEVSTKIKNPDVPWNEKYYRISATSRGKEVKLFLTNASSKSDKAAQGKAECKFLSILVRFGMSGKFEFTHKNGMDKHAHLNFYTKEGDMVLSFVDYRRFGRWELTDDWGPKRGPCILTEPEAFRENVLRSLDVAIFNRPICEAMLDQRYFNGVGNYLRAEILYRLGIPPFEQARKVLEPQPLLSKIKSKGQENGKMEEQKESAVKDEMTEREDVLRLLTTCHTVAMEVVQLSEDNNGKNVYLEEEGGTANNPFFNWLRCYYKDGMENIVDSNSRTIWFHGPVGPMAPKTQKSRAKVKRKKLIEKSAAENKTNDTKKIKLASTDGKMRKTSRSKPTKSDPEVAPSNSKKEKSSVKGTTTIKEENNTSRKSKQVNGKATLGDIPQRSSCRRKPNK